MSLPRIHIEKEWFKDEHGRAVILRGVNLGGDSKVPFSPDESTHLPTDFENHRHVSFIGRPFPLSNAPEHFARLKAWGFNCLRLLITWEAVEHEGPGVYDTEYLEYFTEICKMAGEYGLYVFVDFHQDVWSRMTGGDGAPGWLFEKIGLDYRKFTAADAAIIMQHAYDFNDPRPRQEDNYPTMAWPRNFDYAPNKIMWTLFFSGRDFAPEFMIDGQNVQDYLQGHFLDCMRAVADRLKELPNIMGFDTLNEPNRGWIGYPMDWFNPNIQRGTAYTPIDALYTSYGYSKKLPYYEFRFFKRKFVPVKEVVVNPNRVSIWLKGRKDPFMAAGAWRLDDDGSYEVLKPDFFRKVDGKKVDYDRDYFAPYVRRMAETVHAANPDWLIFAGKDIVETIFSPSFDPQMPKNTVNASHWYDSHMLFRKKFGRFSFDSYKRKPVFGYRNIGKMYISHLSRYKEISARINQGCPTLIGEFGIPFDLNNASAYQKWAAGDHSSKPWRRQIKALDLIYNAVDHLLLSSTIWNYTATNQNDPRIGDCWNQEDLSLFSLDQKIDPKDINSGGRATEGWLRPFARRIQGTPIEMKFDLKTREFCLRFLSNPEITHPTEIFVPRFQYPAGFHLEAEHVEVERDDDNQLLQIHAKEKREITITILPRKA